MDLVQALKAEGCRVAEVPGWRTRRHPGAFKPFGGLLHHTAGHNDLGIVVNGRPDLAGPLCNLYLSRDGVVHVVSDGVAWHAGPGSAKVMAEIRAAVAAGADARARKLPDDYQLGNHQLVGVEVENDGKEPLTPAQVAAIPQLMAACCKLYGFKPYSWRHHRQWTSRKVDMADRTHDFQALAAMRLTGKSKPGVAAMAVTRRVLRTVLRNPYVGPAGNSTVKPGSSGTTVRWIQWAVGAKVDGSYGPATVTAVKSFQGKHHLLADGVAGPKTLAQLRLVTR